MAEPAHEPGAPVEPGDDGQRPALGPRRLHPAGIALSALDSVRDALITFVLVVVIGSRSSELGALGTTGLALAAVLVAVALGYLRWSRESYAVVDGAIRHRRGVVAPDETVVPLTRVHSIDTAEGPVQRLFGVHELHVQVPGGGAKGEIVLRAVTADAARELRELAGLEEPPRPDLPEWRLSGRTLAVAALTAPQIGVLLPIVGGGLAMFDNLILVEAGDRIGDGGTTAIGTLVAIALAIGLGAWLLAFLGALVAFAGFTAVRDGDRLRIRRGLLQRRAASVPLRRIHAVRILEGPLRRPFGLCSVRLETTGYGREPSVARTLLPVVRLADLDSVLAPLVPAFAGVVGGPPLDPPPPRARRRYALREVAAGLGLGIAATAIWPGAWPAIPLLALAGALDGLNRHRVAGWRLGDGRLTLRRGSVAHRTLVARTDRLQAHSLAQSPFQRRAGLATLGVTVASGTSSDVSHLELSTAGRLFDRLRPPPAQR